MPTVYMNGASGNVAGKRKRMPGANHVNKPEVKAYDPFHNVAEVGVFSSIDICNMTCVPIAAQNAVKGSNFPISLDHPVLGEEANERIGNRYFLKFLKFKGDIYIRRTNPWTAHWRLVLVRTSNVPVATFLDQYYTFYQQADLTTQGDLSALDATRVMSHATHNFYKKMTEPANNKIFRRKVIASGVVPSIFEHTSSNQYALSGNPGLIKTVTMTTPRITMNSAMFLPINVTVKCNDNVDVTTDRYWIVFENDIGVGFDYSMAWNITNNGLTANSCLSDENVDWRVFGANFYCKAYFTDK